MAKQVQSKGKVTFGVKKKGKAVKHPNKHSSTKDYHRQG